MVAIVVAGIEWNWQNGDRFELWDFLRNTLHGARLAMIGTGMKEAEADFEMLRDVAYIRAKIRAADPSEFMGERGAE